ncbi:major facilitator superfamily MFS_1 [Vulcanisaeta moutnovskia 768-28]|uniref:Major facilitator superfamily MFS_1 n=1 Tax=Vulcanisaeta moutnovskia (strain 768-28) TaxID=985053 RepID=F0QT60_VULM7|nr:MFS transporter [Vulcanisaeta moutnovskia]ADY01649.1 major facilitator superfamily MFS_1 [Vulcanisaeta moutnovskia 768-28]
MELSNKLALIGAVRSLGGSLLWSFTGFALFQYYRLPLTLTSIFYVAQAVVSSIAFVIGGYLADFLGRVRTMIISAVVSSIVLIIAYLINRPLVVVIMVLIQSFFNNVYGVANTSIVGDYARSFSSLVRYFSRLRVGINAGWAIGPAIGGLLYEVYGFRVLMLLGSIIPLAALPLLVSLNEPNYMVETGLTFHVNKSFALFLIPTFLTFLVMGQLGFPLLTYYNAHDGLTTFQVGLLYMENGLLVVFLQDLIGRYLKKPSLISLGMVIYGVSYLTVAFIPNFAWAIADMFFITFAEMIVSPLSQSIANTLADPRTRGRYMGLYSLVTGLGRTTASSISSLLLPYALRQPLAMWGFVFAVSLSSTGLYAILVKDIAVVSRRA